MLLAKVSTRRMPTGVLGQGNEQGNNLLHSALARVVAVFISSKVLISPIALSSGALPARPPKQQAGRNRVAVVWLLPVEPTITELYQYPSHVTLHALSRFPAT